MKTLVVEPSSHIPWTWRQARAILFRFDAEKIHEISMRALAVWSKTLSLQGDTGPMYGKFMGLDFKNPIGVAAGLDKNAVAVPALFKLGFGHVEVGTVTAKPQPGNPKPRLFRVPEAGALVNRMGFNNDGAKRVARRLEELRKSQKLHRPLGINIGKSKVIPLEKASEDYLESFETLADYADYLVINVSSPNTPGLRELQTQDNLQRILEALQSSNQSRAQKKPILVKFSPDMELDELLRSLEIARKHSVVGAVLTNTTIDHSKLSSTKMGLEGGLSGRPLFSASTEVLKKVRKEVPQDFVLIGVGGIMDAETARSKLAAGANLIQVYTGFVFGGPTFAKNICKALEN